MKDWKPACQKAYEETGNERVGLVQDIFNYHSNYVTAEKTIQY